MKVALTFRPEDAFFYPVHAFCFAFGGINSYLRADNPMKYKPGDTFGLTGRVAEDYSVDLYDLSVRLKESSEYRKRLTKSLGCMLVVTAYEMVKAENDRSPIFEFFRHVRNAGAHGNTFEIRGREPARPAYWHSLSINDSKKGTSNPLHGSECLYEFLAPADLMLLLADVQAHIRETRTCE